MMKRLKCFCYIMLCLSLVGCRSKNSVILLENNELLAYVNYIDSTEIGFPVVPFNHCTVISDFSLDAEKQSDKTPIIGNDSILIFRIIDDFRSQCHEPDEKYNAKELDKKVDLFFCGKISIVDSIDGYLVLLEEPDRYDDRSGSVVKTLYLLNYKGEQLTSVVNLSTQMSGIDPGIKIITFLIRSVRVRDYYYSQIDFSFVTHDKSHLISELIPKKQPKEILSSLKIKKDVKVLYYSLFKIDENGSIILLNK